MTDAEKLKKVLDEIGIPYEQSYYYISFKFEDSRHGSRKDVGFSIYFDETNNHKFHSIEGNCYRDHPQDYDPWDE